MSEFLQPAGETGAMLRRTLRRQLEQMQPPLRTLAENVLADGSRIDLVTRDPLGGVVVVLIADIGQDLEVFTRALAHRSWVQQRVPDWTQLAPELDLSPSVHALVLCPKFRPETIAAARSVEPLVRLSVYRDLQDVSGPLLLEPIQATPDPQTRAQPAPQSGREPADSRGTAAVRPSEFRSGLSEADLQITPEERSEFA